MFPVELIHFSVIAGLDPAIHLLAKKMDPRVIRAFTPVFDGLCPRVTTGVSLFNRNML
jgi:hypothetical protein